ncbi:uncharacterized protein J7T54_004074 [Emericellopsis cladophorae]|uniref:Uncharacterized protein n=1 Tax=Emericellopsis cladophorae TaxID=2686198 RepID=A0A9P9Y0M3_9HYPO|nr:uncharacterized protein J7T54_004074 [Emericellopsis cladophorae]KAI6781301.1 hypothetical protein J7T54_004074 [Emericellopsis cladophorae]
MPAAIANEARLSLNLSRPRRNSNRVSYPSITNRVRSAILRIANTPTHTRHLVIPHHANMSTTLRHITKGIRSRPINSRRIHKVAQARRLP